MYKVSRTLCIPEKLNLRQIGYSLKVPRKLKGSQRFFEKCPNHLQIPLKQIFKAEIIIQGHVTIGFTEDGRYLLTYICNLRFNLTDTSICSYQYVLHWWKFDLWNKLEKVHECELFPKENITNEVYLILCQNPASNFIVVHGSLVNTDSQSNGKMCYVSLIPKFSQYSPGTEDLHSIHLKYELLPPHPPFLTSVSLKLNNVVVFNSGDMLFAIILPDGQKLFTQEDVDTKLESHKKVAPTCYCHQNVLTRHNRTIPVTEDSEDEEENIIDYVSFINQGFVQVEEEPADSLPNSPFDCTTTVIPCSITTLNGQIQLKNSFEHRCFKFSDKGSVKSCDYFIGQAQFDAENFMNTQLHKREDIRKNLVSLKDYDLQLVEACPEENEVIVLINALVVLRIPVNNGTTKPSENLAIDPLEEEKSLKLVRCTIGYIASWNVCTGLVNVLKEFPLTERPGNICKARNFSPSYAQSAQLRKAWFTPPSKHSSVLVTSNHTVLTGRSLQFIFHPEYPVAVVL